MQASQSRTFVERAAGASNDYEHKAQEGVMVDSIFSELIR
jgi:hypothetical protein